ncbi:41436_t:CDS:2, partial [Gigaspora margarita]
MDNGSNMVKGIKLLKDNCIENVFRQPCTAHMLQLSVEEGLKQIKSVHQRLKTNLSQETNENEIISPLEILTDSVSLQINSDTISKKEGEKLDYLCLTSGEKNWITLIYGPSLESSGTSDNTSTSSDDEASIPLAGNRKHKNSAELADNDSNTVKYLPPTSCEGLLEKMCTAIYLSLDKLWSIPNEVGLKASILDPQALKLLPFATANERKNTKEQIHEELSILKAQSGQNNTITETSTIKEECDSLSAELWNLFSIPVSHAITED